MTRGETGKQRQTRIELKYYKRPDAIARWRARIILITVALAGLWFALAPVWERRTSAPVRLFEWDRLASPGPLARVHSTFESRCDACHVPFQPMNASHLTPFAAAKTSESNQRCQACHTGPTHHASQVPHEREMACSACHHDHRGEEVSLVRVDDTSCTTCHADLPNHHDKNLPFKEPAVAKSVTHFDADPNHHPDFFVVKNKKDPGRLKFNHALHRAPGYTLEPSGQILTFAQVADGERTRYGWNSTMPLETPVPPLEDCRFCHRLDSDEVAASGNGTKTVREGLPSRGAGEYMLPVTYKNDCRACHPLEFDSKSPGQQIPHGLSPRDVLDQLRQFYQAQAVKLDPDLLRRYIPTEQKPGKPAKPVSDQIGRAVDDKVLIAVRILFGSGVNGKAMKQQELPNSRRGCVECHYLVPSPDRLVNADAIRDVAIEPVKVPSVWFERARFDHSAHRAVDCIECHANVNTSRKSADVLLPGIKDCIKCHGPATNQNGQASGGAGDSCTECHRFHNGDHPLQGIGASARGVINRQTINQFLQGVPLRRVP
jgi:hypothetical protein